MAAISAQHLAALDERGYVVLPGFMSARLLDELTRRVEELFAAEGDQAGREFKQEPGCRRLANLADKGDVFLRIAADTVIGQLAAHVLGRYKLSSLNARSANPRAACRQPLHADMGAVPDEAGYWVFNTIWLLTDFTPDNGALRVVPGTHRSGRRPQDVLEDPRAPHPDEVLLTGRAGDVIAMNAHVWHGATDNTTDAPRTAVHVFFVRRDKPQQQYQKQWLRPQTQQRLSGALRELLALDDPLNDALCAQSAGQSGFLKAT
jgi:ectoine hydroxylase-related dioxygenase (phytanoyl-CoA dioxygenase family)